MRLLVTRPQPQADTTAARLKALGHMPLLSPLLDTQPLAWTLPDALPPATLFTSATALRLGGPQLAALHALPAFAVGGATAAALARHGYADIRNADGDASAALALARAQGFDTLLHLAGADRSVAVVPPEMTVTVCELYAATRVAALDSAARGALVAGEIDAVLLYSPRAAAHFARLIDAAGLHRAGIALAGLSPAIIAAAGPGWARTVAAERSNEDALFAAIGLACDTAPSTKVP